jgi:cytochrome c-type biogenesis protein CcmF
VMLGTLYPLVLDALGLGKISVGPPYFEAVFVPLMAPVVLLMGIGPLARWGTSPLPDLLRRLRGPLLTSTALALLLPWWAGRWSFGVAAGLFLAAWVFSSTVVLLAQRLRGGTSQLLRATPAFHGMWLAHLGVGVFIVGVTMVRGFETEKDVKMSIGDSVTVAGHQFTLKSLSERTGPNFVALRGDIEVQPEGGTPFTMHPEKRLYRVQQMPMTEAAIDIGLTRDLYVSLGEAIDEKTWTVRVYHKPFVDWIWGGALFMALGGLLALGDRRYRLAVPSEGRVTDPAAAAVATTQVAVPVAQKAGS